MRIYDLIAKKRDGGTHSREELEAIVNGFVSGEVADYQMVWPRPRPLILAILTPQAATMGYRCVHEDRGAEH